MFTKRDVSYVCVCMCMRAMLHTVRVNNGHVLYVCNNNNNNSLISLPCYIFVPEDYRRASQHFLHQIVV